jgi:DNA topoisomerase-6 subunit B
LQVFMNKRGQADMAKKRANLYSKYIPLIAQFCTELAGMKKEPDYKKMLKEEIDIPVVQEKQEEPIVDKNPIKEEEIIVEKVKENK